MIVQSLREHFPARLIEWFMAGLMVSWGLYVLGSPDMFTHPAERDIFAYMAAMSSWTGIEPSIVWGLGSTVFGAVRALALFVNGAYVRTPVIRVAMSFVSAFIWTQILLCIVYSGLPNPAVAVYSWLVIADIVSAYRASKDAVLAEAQRRREKDKGTNRVAGFTSYA